MFDGSFNLVVHRRHDGYPLIGNYNGMALSLVKTGLDLTAGVIAFRGHSTPEAVDKRIRALRGRALPLWQTIHPSLNQENHAYR
ncbi:hypothetical protein IWX65_002768 [Arthrobacter sp. CAN_A214]